MFGVAVSGPTAEKRGAVIQWCVTWDAFQTVGELTPEAGSPHDAPVSSTAPPSPARGGSWVFTIRQFIPVMKLCSQREKGWPVGPTTGSEGGGGGGGEGGRRGGGGCMEASDVILLEVSHSYKGENLEWNMNWNLSLLLRCIFTENVSNNTHIQTRTSHTLLR